MINELTEIKRANNLSFSPNGSFWRVGKSKANAGVVALLRSIDKFVGVQKAKRKGYEFSNLVSLPGGMISCSGNQEFEFDLQQSLFRRTSAEAGLASSQMKELSLPADQKPIVTSYFAKGQQRFTVLFHAVSTITDTSFKPRSSDSSVSSAGWQNCASPDWEKFTPGNLLIIYKILEPELTADEKRMALPHVKTARKKCNHWAVGAGLPELTIS